MALVLSSQHPLDDFLLDSDHLGRSEAMQGSVWADVPDRDEFAALLPSRDLGFNPGDSGSQIVIEGGLDQLPVLEDRLAFRQGCNRMVHRFPRFAKSPFFSEGSDGTAGGSFNHRVGLVLKPLGVPVPSGNLLLRRKRSLLVADFMSNLLPDLSVGYPSRFFFPLFDSFLDLPRARALRFEILLRVAFDLDGIVGAPLDFEAAR